MEIDSPVDEFIASSNLYSVATPTKEAAVYLQRILKSKEYDIDSIFNQFYLCIHSFLKSPEFDLSSYLISLLKSLKDIYALPILTKKILQAFEAASTSLPDKISLPTMKSLLSTQWKEIEPEALDLFVKILSIELPPQEY